MTGTGYMDTGRFRFIAGVVATALTAVGCASGPSTAGFSGDFGPQQAQTEAFRLNTRYLIYFPPAYLAGEPPPPGPTGRSPSGARGTTGERNGTAGRVGSEAASSAGWPLLVFLHGAGERGEDLSLVTVHGPPKLARDGQELPFVVVSPQGRAGVGWNAEELDHLIGRLLNEHRIDQDRVYLTGLSLGAIGAMDLAGQHGDRFAAVALVSGGRTSYWTGRCFAPNIPFRLYHGEQDPVIPVEWSFELAAELRACGNDRVALFVYPEVGHDAWTQTYASREFWNWLAAQRRPSR